MSVINDMMSDIFSRLAECASINARAAVFSGALASGPLDATALRAAAQHVLPQPLFERAAALTSDALSHCERTSAFEDWPAQHERSGLAFSLRAVLAVLATTQQTGPGESRAVEQSQGRVCVGGVCVTAAVCAAAVLETVAQRVLECARQVSAAHVTTQSVFDAVCADADLAALLDGVSVFNRTVRAGFCSSSSDLPRANSIPRDDRDEAEASVACKWGVRHSMVPHAEFRAIVSAEWLWDFMSDFNADGDAIEALHCAAEAYMVEHFRTGPRAWKRPKLFHVEGADEAESQHSEEDEEEAFVEGDEEQEEELEEEEDEEEDEDGEEDEE